MWAPSSTDACQRFLASFVRLAAAAAAQLSVELLIPHVVLPGCTTPAARRDLWTHPVLTPKWQAIVAGVEFLEQPAQMVLSTTAGPIFVERSFVLM